MTDPTEFSVGMSVNPANPFKPLSDQVAFDLCHAYPLPDGSLLLHNTHSGKRAKVKPAVYASLVHCRQFKTLGQHTESIIAQNPGMQGQQADIRKVLQRMLDSGIMLSAKNTCDRLKTKVENKSEEENDTPVIAILTWDRPQALERLLDSIVANCDTGAFHRLYVIDDSRKAENISQNKALTDKFSSKIVTELQYFGRAVQRALLTGLVEQLPEHESAIHFLADQSRWKDYWTAGLTRNLALLLSCGHRLVMIDDDTICDVYEPLQKKNDITFSDGPREAEFFGSVKEWAHLHQPINPDPVNRHMQCLGLTFSEALTKLGQNNLKPAGFAGATALQLSELQPDSEVLITACGSLGSPGTVKNTWLPDMAPVSLKRMLESVEKTTHALGSRKVWSGRKQPHFAPRSHKSQITGFDNRRMLPPYLPNLRNQHRFFSYMLDFIFPTSVTLDYPWAIPHLQLPDRQWRDRDLNFTPADSFPMFFVEKIIEHRSSCHSASPGERLLNLSAWFNDMATASADSLSSMCRDSRLRGNADRLGQLTSLLATSESAPVNWQNYLRNGISQLNADLDKASRTDFTIRGLPATMEGDELIIFWKDVWGDFATALKAWPEIRAAATRIISSM